MIKGNKETIEVLMFSSASVLCRQSLLPFIQQSAFGGFFVWYCITPMLFPTGREGRCTFALYFRLKKDLKILMQVFERC
jgi:hypothetical protein